MHTVWKFGNFSHSILVQNFCEIAPFMYIQMISRNIFCMYVSERVFIGMHDTHILTKPILEVLADLKITFLPLHGKSRLVQFSRHGYEPYIIISGLFYPKDTFYPKNSNPTPKKKKDFKKMTPEEKKQRIDYLWDRLRTHVRARKFILQT